MLSIDITDTRISLVCGSVKDKNVTVNKTLTRELPQGCIENGLVKDVRTLAGEITELLVTEKISEKETVVLLNSGLILFKEMVLPKPKRGNAEEILERMIRNDMGLVNDYNFTYSIIKEESVNKMNMLRLLAVACPQRLVDSYQQLFKQLGIKLKAIYNGNTCLVRLFTNTSKYVDKMPLVAIELENDYVNFNLFEDNRLTLSRYVRIDSSDRMGRTEGMNQTVFENLFRIFQLFSQGSERIPPKNIVYYGFTNDTESLEESISQFNVPVSRLEKPDEITYNVDTEFMEYAAIIGSLYPVNKITENINLFHSFKYRNTLANIKYIIVAVITVIACVIGITLGYSAMSFHLFQRKMVLDSYAVEYAMLRPTDLSTEKSELLNAISSFNTYSEKVELARELFYFQPKMLPDIVSKLRKELLPGMQIYGNVTVNSYDVTVTFACSSEDQPSRYTETLEKAGYFENIIFNGYEKASDENKYIFTLKMRIKGGNRFEVK